MHGSIRALMSLAHNVSVDPHSGVPQNQAEMTDDVMA